MGLRDLARYLVAKALAGRSDVIEALYRYFVLDESIGVVAARYGFTKHQVRGYVQRVIEKVPRRLAAKAIEVLYPYLTRIKPVIYRDGRVYRCKLCNLEFINEYAAEDHVRIDHLDLVDDIVVAIAAKAVRRA